MTFVNSGILRGNLTLGTSGVAGSPLFNGADANTSGELKLPQEVTYNGTLLMTEFCT
jgi:hypothetical protein